MPRDLRRSPLGAKSCGTPQVFEQVPKFKRDDNSYATPTPVTDGEHVYAVFSSGGIVALDMAGRVAWTNTTWSSSASTGLGASPILHENLLIMPFDGSSPGEDSLVGFKKGWDGAVLLALDKPPVRWPGGVRADRHDSRT